MDQFDIPMDADHYVFHPNMIDSVRIRGIGDPSIRSAAAEADHSNEGYQVGAVPDTSAAISAWPFRGREAELALIAQDMTTRRWPRCRGR